MGNFAIGVTTNIEAKVFVNFVIFRDDIVDAG